MCSYDIVNMFAAYLTTVLVHNNHSCAIQRQTIVILDR